MGHICSFLWRGKNKDIQLQGGGALPPIPTGGYAPGPPLGDSPPDPRYRLALAMEFEPCAVLN